MIVKLPKTGRTEAQVMAAVIDAAHILGIDLDEQGKAVSLGLEAIYAPPVEQQKEVAG